MFAKATNVGFAQQVVATLVACAVVLWSVGAYSTAQAANLTNVSNTLTDSDMSVTSAHTIEFTIPAAEGTGLTAESFTITFPTGAFTNVANVADGNTTVTGGGVATVAAVGDVVTVSNVTAAAGGTITVAIDDGIITNPATEGSYEIVIETPSDIGKTRVAILDNVVVTAIVETSFDFIVSGTATSTAINGTTTTGSTTATEIPFGTLAAGVVETLAQDLSVSTNARNGFVVTVQSDGNLESSTGAIIDNFADGSDVATPGTGWVSPTNDINDETTWGHWGLTTNDSDIGTLGGFYASTDFGANEFIGASTTAREVFHHDGPSDGVTTDIGTTTVGYQIEITPLQEAGDDYNTTLTYIATPTF